MNEYIEKTIKAEADKVREKLKGGYLFGEPINMDNPDHLTLGAYLLAEAEQRTKYLHDLDFTRKLFRAGRRSHG